jgi:DNA-binding GntR family transcriptional regulator
MTNRTEPPAPPGPSAATAEAGQGGPLARSIAHRLRREILLGRLAPGSQIKERDTAVELGVSRTPMREALRLLAQEGLVDLRPARSPVVANPSFDQVRDDLEVMIGLEVMSGRLACRRATAEDLVRLGDIHRDLADSYDRVEPVDLFEIDMAFHRGIAEAAKNQSLAETHRAYLDRLWRARYLSASQRRNRERVVTQHGAILAALQNRDPSEAARHIERHLQDLVTNIAGIYGGPTNDKTAVAGGDTTGEKQE